MNKQKVLYNQVIFTIIMVFIVSFLVSPGLWAAQKIDFYTGNTQEYIRLLNENDSRIDAAIGPIFDLTPDEKFTLLRQRTDFNQVTHSRYQQLYKGFPVWGTQVVISRDSANKVVRLHGSMVQGTPHDVREIPYPLDAFAALRQMQELHKEKDEGAVWNFRNEKFGTYIYLDKNEKAHLCYVVSFFADTECGNPSQPIFFIDVKTGKVFDSFDMLRHAFGVGPGGSEKIGCYYYGIDYPGFCVTQEGSTCTMDCPKVKTVDLNHGTSGTTAYSYTCYENTPEAINGAYSPLNDAQYFGYAVINMYNDWFYVDPLPFQLVMRCHYSTNYQNAFWDGSTITFGDGYTFFYPLVALDVVSHEVAHGFTEFNSYLIYSGPAGSICEAFSDMAGEAAKYHVRGTNDFLVGQDIFKSSGALRYMCDPPLDGYSIDHIDDYYYGLDPNYAAGIFNKAFCLIANSSGWNTRMAFSIFVKANQDYWTPTANFQQGAEGARDAALDYGYPCQDVLNAFAAVGITITCPGSTGYCASSGSSQFYEYIAGVQVGGLNNSSGPAPYSDFTGLTPTDLTRGSTINVTLTPGFPDRPFVECWKTWIDYNRDNDFDDAGEEVFTGSGDSPVSGNFTVPCCCMVGETRMRVSMNYYYSGCPPYCGTFSYGEVEDYTVNIL